MEPYNGFEPSSSAWRAEVLAITPIRHRLRGPTLAGRSLSSGVPLVQFIKRRYSVGGPAAGPMRLAQSTRLERALPLQVGKLSRLLSYRLLHDCILAMRRGVDPHTIPGTTSFQD